MNVNAAADAVERPESSGRWVWLAALGIVYGDLGTSPLYTLQTVTGALGGQFTRESALGVLSLIFWTLIITVSVKYCLFVMRADNRGTGGIMALMSLVGANSLKHGARILTAMGLLGAALIYGDGVITPAISVLSAIEGVNVVSDVLKPFVMPIAAAILIALFAAQRFGTERIGHAFGPIMLLWFLVIALMGLSGIARNPEVLIAVDPRHAIRFLAHSSKAGLILGGVFLCITGAEALYADMGHLGRGPIRRSWYGIVLPALLLSYAGQIALLLERGTVAGNPFFQLAPSWSVIPLVVLATLATIIASQAIITGSFAMTRQAMQLGWLPGVNIRQTSDRAYGQIYVPAVNWLMMVATVTIAVAFGSSDRLAGAYGTAVATTMLLTSCLLYAAMRRIWRWALPVALGVSALFLLVDSAFFAANLLKIAEGGWLPLTLGAVVFFLMSTWRAGADCVHEKQLQLERRPQHFLEDLRSGRLQRVAGTAIFLTRSKQNIPPLLVYHVEHMGALHEHVLTLTVEFATTPRVARQERCSAQQLCDGIWHATARFGFIEIPDLRAALRQLPPLSSTIDLEQAIFFAARDLVVPKPGAGRLAHWRVAVFAFMYRNAVKVVDRFNLPPARVVEIARQIEI
ncbi:MAG: KUP/HAK/KT family potassium transporter [Sinobacteraceae bacterium]|nr:KUP/HAK/KT family potassium transporter [Nevskiaceae bacterium]